ncbi:FmdB family zinc ribbon protein [Skermania piniformis]|uniref:FmdB family transcriptional regulator n=1 Tax=Skermania pinensis TaxID=39122 RepID=A0ABX8S879_9ACTN|nr:FmdB family zinc ribbon protein [Skermania piniformis]QXQ13202.1 FmdB family transcriptional regulator [Skermania piniformis]
MPTYSYACTQCDNRFDVTQAFTDDALTVCPECSGRLRKLFNSVGIVFKGSGFYRTDSRGGTNGTESAKSDADKSGSNASESGKPDSGKSGAGKSDSSKSAAGETSTGGGKSGKSESKGSVASAPSVPAKTG